MNRYFDSTQIYNEQQSMKILWSMAWIKGILFLLKIPVSATAFCWRSSSLRLFVLWLVHQIIINSLFIFSQIINTLHWIP